MGKGLSFCVCVLLGLQAVGEVTATPLTEAVKKKQPVKALRSILQNGDQDLVDKPDSNDRTPLMLAIRSSQWETAQFLIENGAKTLRRSRTDRWHRSMPIEQLIYSNAPVDLLEYAVIGLPDPNSIPLDSRINLLHLAVAYNHTEQVRLLLEKGLDATAADWSQETPLYTAVARRRVSLDLVREMLTSRDKNTISTSLNSGRSVLAGAIENGDWDAVRLLIEFGADVTLKLGKDHIPIVMAVKHHVGADLFKEMLKSQEVHKVMESVNSANLDPLHAALQERRWDLAHLLLQFGSDVTRHYPSPFTCGVYNGVPLELFREMLASQDRIQITKAINNNRYTLPLHAAICMNTSVSGGRWDLVQLLLEHGADATVTSEGRSAIQQAVRCKIEVAKLQELLESQPRDKVTHALRTDKASLEHALKSAQFSIASLLLRHGADATVTTNGASLIYIAIDSGADIELIRDLLESHEADGITEALNTGKDALVKALQQARWDVARLLIEFGADPARIYRHKNAQDVAEELLQTYGEIEETRVLLEAIIHPPAKSKSALKA